MSENRKPPRGGSEAVRLVDRSGKPLRILIVEDEPLTAMDYALLIEDAGAQVLGTASTACAAEALTKTLSPDAILMDVRLIGRRDGIEAAHAIRAFSAAQIIFVTAYSEAATRARIQEFNGTNPVIKPAEAKALIAAVANSMAH